MDLRLFARLARLFGLLLLCSDLGCTSTRLMGHRPIVGREPTMTRASRLKPADLAAGNLVDEEAAVTETEPVDVRRMIQQTSADDSQIVRNPAEASDKSGTANLPRDLVIERRTIDFTTALLLTSGENPQVSFAKWRIEESLAQRDRADALWLPSIRAGLNYNKHEGRIQDVAGSVIETSRGSFYSGLGAGAVGAGSPAVPGLVAQFHLADAIYQPRIAAQTACARQSGAVAATNDALWQTSLAYVQLMRSAQSLSVSLDIQREARELERVTREFARTGQGLAADHHRARTELAFRTNEVHRADEQLAMASARLAEQVRWDASQQLIPAEEQLTPIDVVSLQSTPQELVAVALAQRPEIAESRHLVGEAIERLERERYAPLIPSVLLGVSYGGLGGGLGSNVTNYGDRLDADAMAYWEIRQLGVGERAIRREAQARIQQSQFREISLLDRVAREVVEAKAQVASRVKQIDVAREAVIDAEESFRSNWVRIQNGQGLPLEVLQSLQALAAARQEYVRVVADYNTAQFTLQRNIGWPIAGVGSSPGVDG